MLYSGGCDFGDEGDGPRAWCGHMLPAVVTSAQVSTCVFFFFVFVLLKTASHIDL
jgi:hypothetical protein